MIFGSLQSKKKYINYTVLIDHKKAIDNVLH